MKTVRVALVLILCSIACSAQTWSKWNGVTVGSSTGNISTMNGKSIGTSTSNYNKWNNLNAAAAGVHTFSFLHVSDAGGCATGTTCAVSPTATTAGSVLVALVFSASNAHINSVSGCGATWVTGSTSSYTAWDATTSNGLSAAYALNATAGCTTATVTMSASLASWDFVVDEFGASPTSPLVTLDALASSNTNVSSCTATCTGSSFTGLTSSDLLVQAVNTGSGISSPTSPYAWDPIAAFAYALGSSSGAAPTWTQTSGVFQTLGFAFK